MEITIEKEFRGSNLMADLRSAVKLWEEVDFIRVDEIVARGVFKVGAAEVTVPAWAVVLPPFGRKNIKLHGMKSLPTTPSDGAVVRVVLSVEGTPRSEPEPPLDPQDDITTNAV